MEYIDLNLATTWQVAAGLCTYPEPYKYSSAKFYESRIDEFDVIKYWMAYDELGYGFKLMLV